MREAILSRVPILNRIHSATSGNVEAVQERLKDRPLSTRPTLPQDTYTCFIERLKSTSATVSETPKAKITHVIKDYLDEKGLPHTLKLPEKMPEIDEQVFKISYGTAQDKDMISVTRAVAGIAETGTCVLLSGEKNATTLNFLPETHVVLLKKHDIHNYYEDVLNLLSIHPPRTINFITGPSRTADIEQKIQLGAHGPKNLHVVVSS